MQPPIYICTCNYFATLALIGDSEFLSHVNDYIENIVGTFAVLAEFIPLNISVMQIYIHVAGMGTNFVQ